MIISESIPIINYCSSKCLFCEGYNNCLKCEDGYEINENGTCSKIPCHSNCKKCYDLSLDNEDMKCLTCLDGLYFIFNTSNCVNRIYYVNYYLNETDNKLYTCSFFEDSNCYECNPNSNSKGICLSCNRGYKYNNDTKECLKCEENEYPIIINDFDGCQGKFENTYCNKYVTHCQPLENVIMWALQPAYCYG